MKFMKYAILFFSLFLIQGCGNGLVCFLSNITFDEKAITFDVEISDPEFMEGIIIELNQGEEVVDLIILENESKNLQFKNLENHTSYTVIVYQTVNEERLDLYKYDFTTDWASIVPNATISNVVIEEERVCFDMILPSTIDYFYNLEVILVKGDEVIEILPIIIENEMLESLTDLEFSDLERKTTYRIFIEATFDFDNAYYESKELGSLSFKTLPKVPTGEIKDTRVEKDTVCFNAEIIDSDMTITLLRAVLLENDEIIESKNLPITDHILEEVEFTDLERTTGYTIQILADYDKGNEILVGQVLASYNFSSPFWYIVPTGEIVNFSVEGDLASFGVKVTDPDNRSTDFSIVLKNEFFTIFTMPLSILTGNEIRLSHLENRSYTLELTVDYLNDDGLSEHRLIQSLDFTVSK